MAPKRPAGETQVIHAALSGSLAAAFTLCQATSGYEMVWLPIGNTLLKDPRGSASGQAATRLLAAAAASGSLGCLFLLAASGAEAQQAAALGMPQFEELPQLVGKFDTR